MAAVLRVATLNQRLVLETFGGGYQHGSKDLGGNWQSQPTRTSHAPRRGTPPCRRPGSCRPRRRRLPRRRPAPPPPPPPLPPPVPVPTCTRTTTWWTCSQPRRCGRTEHGHCLVHAGRSGITRQLVSERAAPVRARARVRADHIRGAGRSNQPAPASARGRSYQRRSQRRLGRQRRHREPKEQSPWQTSVLFPPQNCTSSLHATTAACGRQDQRAANQGIWAWVSVLEKTPRTPK